MEEQAKYPPQPYTQKLLDLGIIEFNGIEDIELDFEDETYVQYNINDAFVLSFKDKHNKYYICSLEECYATKKNEFRRFCVETATADDIGSVSSIDDLLNEEYYGKDVIDSVEMEKIITIYKKMEI